MLTFRPRTGGGIILDIRSTSEYGISSARPTSLIAARDARVPKVTIWQTESRPYSFETWLITSARPRTQKSISMSGIETRGIEKSFEEEVVLQRIDIGDP